MACTSSPRYSAGWGRRMTFEPRSLRPACQCRAHLNSEQRLTSGIEYCLPNRPQSLSSVPQSQEKLSLFPNKPFLSWDHWRPKKVNFDLRLPEEGGGRGGKWEVGGGGVILWEGVRPSGKTGKIIPQTLSQGRIYFFLLIAQRKDYAPKRNKHNVTQSPISGPRISGGRCDCLTRSSFGFLMKHRGLY